MGKAGRRVRDLDGFAEFILARLAGTKPDFPEDRGGDELPLYFRDRDAKKVFFALGSTAGEALKLISRIPEGHTRTWILADEKGVARIGIEGSRQAAECLIEWMR